MVKRSFAELNAEPSSESFDANFVERTAGLAQQPSQDVSSFQFIAPGNTQTQTHMYNLEPFSYSEFCQKENLQSPSQSKSQLPLGAPPSPSSPPLKDPAQALQQHYNLEIPPLNLEPKQTPLQPQYAPSTLVKTPISKPLSKPRPLTEEPKQESFGGGPDPAQALRLSDKFQMPISQLGRSTEEEESGQLDKFSRSSTPLGPPPATFVRSSPPTSPVPSHGRKSNERLCMDEEIATQANVASQAMTSPSSSYGRYIDGKSDRELSPVQELLATQTNRAPSEAHSQASLDSEAAFAEFGLSNMRSAATDALTIRFYQQVAGESQMEEATQPTRPGEEATQPSVPQQIEEEKTQPSFPPINTAPPAVEKTPTQSSVRNIELSRGTTFPNAPMVASPLPTSMDIVPDSESPHRNDRDSTSPSPAPRMVGKKPISTNKTPRRRPNQINDGDVVSDSMDADNSEEEENVAHTLAQLTPNPTKKEEEESSEESDDVPLAKQQLRTRTTMGPPPIVKKKVGRKTKSEPKPRGRKKADDVVPSSLPEQDKAPKSKTKGIKKEAAKAQERRSESVASTGTRRSRRQSTDMEGRYREISDSEEEAAQTELDDGYEDELALGPSANKKRKRAAATDAGAGSHKPESKDTDGANEQTPARKRTRTTTSRSSSPQEATKVFALWKPNKHYYPGYVQSHDSGIYTICFFDGHEGVSRLNEMRALDLRIGDEVEFEDSLVTVTNVDDLGDMVVAVKMERGTKEIDVKGICIPVNVSSKFWPNRMIDPASVVTAMRLNNTAPIAQTPSKRSLSGPSTLTGILSQYAFLLTKNGETEKKDKKGKGKKEECVEDSIKSLGGTIFDLWQEVLSLDGVFRSNQRNWHINAADISCKFNGTRSYHFNKILCIAATPKLTPKYMMALALGVPCVSEDWIHEVVKQDKVISWSNYLLPQGICESLKVRVSQRIDLSWGDNPRHLRQLWSNNPFRTTLFQNRSILLIGSNFIPKKSCHPHAQLRYAVACMGASYVEATDDLATVTRNLSSFDFVVIHERTEFERYQKELSSVKQVITVPWLKDSIVMGRYMAFEKFP